jgi:hypothetical protein
MYHGIKRRPRISFQVITDEAFYCDFMNFLELSRVISTPSFFKISILPL